MSFSDEKKQRIKHLALIFASALVLMLVFAGNTSPLYPHYNCLDSSMFLLTGKGMLEGKICYVDLFDHKGPVFFLMEAAGYALGGRTGVWLLESLLLAADFLILEKISKRLGSAPLLPIVAFAAVFFYTFSHGNLTEEFSMPFILAALYGEICFFTSDSKTHPPLLALLYGAVIGILAFVRLNNAIPVCVPILCIGVELVKAGQWKNLLANFALGLVGIALIAVPVCLYYRAHGALDDMLYATFLHNLLYAKDKTHELILSGRFLHFLLLYAPGAFSIAVFAHKLRTLHSRLYTMLLVTAAVTYAALLYSNVYEHYFMLGIPLFAIALAVAFPNADPRSALHPQKRRPSAICAAAVLAAYCVMSLYSGAAPIYKTYISGSANRQYEQIAESVKCIPESERSSLICFNVLADFYVHADITPCYKYYTLQKWMTTDERNVYGDFLSYVKETPPTWIVINVGETDEGILAVLESYTPVVRDDYCVYYRLNTPT